MKLSRLWISLLLLGGTHGIADAVTGFSAGQLFHRVSSSQAILIVLAYNLVGFGLQPVFGWIVDRLGKRAQATTIGFALIGLGLILFPQSLIAAFICMAIGSGLFHVGAGALSSLLIPKKTIGASIFTAPGVIGLALGTVAGLMSLPVMHGLSLVLILGLIGLAWINFKEPTKTLFAQMNPSRITVGIIFLILLFVLGTAARSFAWTAIGAEYFGWRSIIELGIAAGLGKLVGGFAADRLGRLQVVLISLFLACASFALGVWPAILFSVFFLQASTPIILATLIQRIPKHASLAAGCVLGLGIFLGGAVYAGMRSNVYALIPALVLSAFCLLVGLYWIRQKDTKPAVV